MTDLEKLDSPIARRDFLAAGAKGIGALGLLGGGLSVIGAPSAFARQAAAKGSLYKASLQLNYLENVQFAGSFFAETMGYYKDAGVDVTLIPGGPNIAPEPVVVSGKALVGVTHTAEVVPAINNGAPLKIIGATFQTAPTCILSKASAPIKKPTDMYGKKIGVSDSNAPTWQAFIKANKLDVSKITVVTVDFSTTTLATGEIQGIVAFADNEPTILQLQGVKTHTMLLSDFNYPLMDDVYIASESALANSVTRGAIVAVMTGESRGWSQVIKNPNGAATLAVKDFGKSLKLSLAQQKLEAKLQNDFVQNANTKKNGLFWLDPATVRATIKSLALGGVKATPAMFTNEILQEVYKNGPRLS